MKYILVLSFVIFSLYSVDAFSKTYRVKIGAMKYSPEHLVVKVGDIIIWTNKDINPHSVTSKKNTFNSGTIRAKKSWTLIATETGEHPYKCVFHGGMKGNLTVKSH